MLAKQVERRLQGCALSHPRTVHEARLFEAIWFKQCSKRFSVCCRGLPHSCWCARRRSKKLCGIRQGNVMVSLSTKAQRCECVASQACQLVDGSSWSYTSEGSRAGEREGWVCGWRTDLSESSPRKCCMRQAHRIAQQAVRLYEKHRADSIPPFQYVKPPAFLPVQLRACRGRGRTGV